MHDPTDSPNSDLSEAFPQIAEALRAGHVVGFSDGRRSAVIANATRDPVEDATTFPRNGRAGVLLLRDAASARDLLLNPSSLAKRLMRNCWPGAVRLTFAQGVDCELVDALSSNARNSVTTDGGLALSVPQSHWLQGLLHRVAFPLVKLDVEDAARLTAAGMSLLQADPASVARDTEIRVDGNRWELVRGEGVSPEDVARMATARILFVCTGNTCRSPLAEGMFRRMLAERLQCRESDLAERGFEVASAGLAAMEGAPASPESVAVCRARGVDLTGHTSQPLTESLLRRSDLIYTMTAGHREAILSQYPEREEDVRLLSPTGEDVSDPIGWGAAAYEECHREITGSLKALVEQMAANH